MTDKLIQELRTLSWVPRSVVVVWSPWCIGDCRQWILSVISRVALTCS